MAKKTSAPKKKSVKASSRPKRETISKKTKRVSSSAAKSASTKTVLAIDIGGTKLALAVVNHRGHILNEIRRPVRLNSGPRQLVQQISDLANDICKLHKPKMAVIASAGPLDPVRGRLLNPTNLKDKESKWGVVEIVRMLQRRLNIPVRLENDAAAALLAERWVGLGRRCKDFAVVTLGTGVGAAVQVQGQLVRAGGNLHTELGHILMDLNEDAPLCGCGNRGCAEALLSGMHFTRRMQKEWGEPELTGEELVRRARSGEAKAVLAFRKYARELARFLCGMVVTFAPQRIILSGGFSNAYELFSSDLQRKLADLL